jgi:hypothetical protein
LFYHYLQKDLLENDVWLFQMLTARLVVALGIWLHPDIYSRLPIAVPYAVRDPLSRGSTAQGIPDQWGSPNSDGFFRDDNSLIKGLPGSLPVTSSSPLFDGRQLGTGFVASHLWRELSVGGLASRHPLTYSFVPNLVWLPSEVAALTDREASFVQSYTQAISIKIFRHLPLDPSLVPIVQQAWDLLPVRDNIPEQGLPQIESLNFFTPSDAWLAGRVKKIREVASALDAVLKGEPVPDLGLSKRYAAGLAGVTPKAALGLRDRLLVLASTTGGS